PRRDGARPRPRAVPHRRDRRLGRRRRGGLGRRRGGLGRFRGWRRIVALTLRVRKAPHAEREAYDPEPVGRKGHGAALPAFLPRLRFDDASRDRQVRLTTSPRSGTVTSGNPCCRSASASACDWSGSPWTRQTFFVCPASGSKKLSSSSRSAWLEKPFIT